MMEYVMWLISPVCASHLFLHQAENGKSELQSPPPALHVNFPECTMYVIDIQC